MDSEFLFENVSDPIIIVDRDFKVVRVNPAFCRFFGIREDKALGKRSCDLFKELNFSRCNEACMRIIKKEMEGGRLVEVPDEHCPHFQHTYPIFDEQGALKEAVMILKTDGHGGKTDAGKDTAGDSDFTRASIYHDLVSPLQVIRASCDMMSMELDELSGDTKDIMREMLDASKRNERRLYEMVRTIRSVPALEDQQVYKTRPVRLERMIRNICSDYQLLLRSGVTLECEVPSHIPSVMADPNLLDRVFFNLLDNASRYTHRDGHIRVTAEHEPDSEQVLIKVFDDGDAISPELQSRIFEKNLVVDPKRKTLASRRDHGWGLYFCKLTVERFGGTIGVESKEGWGTEFSFTLPISSSTKSSGLRRA